MSISHGHTTKDLALYPLVKQSFKFENTLCSEYDLEEFDACSILTIGKALYFENETKDDILRSFINDPCFFTLTTS